MLGALVPVGGAGAQSAPAAPDPACDGETAAVLVDASSEPDLYAAYLLAGTLNTDCLVDAGERTGPLPDQTAAHLSVSTLTHGYAIGGTTAIPPAKLPASLSWRRAGGADRWATLRIIGNAAADPTTLPPAGDTTAQPAGTGGPPPADCDGETAAVLVDANSEPDLYAAYLLAGTLNTDCLVNAGERTAPLPGESATQLTASTLTHGYAVGGTAAVPPAKLPASLSWRRAGGADRWATLRIIGNAAADPTALPTETPPPTNTQSGFSQHDDAKERELLPSVIMPHLTIKLTSGPNCSVYIHKLEWRNTLDYDATPDDNINDDYANANPPMRIGVYIRDIDRDTGDDLLPVLTPVTQIPIEGKAKQTLRLPSRHNIYFAGSSQEAQAEFQAIYNDAKDTAQRTLQTRDNYLFSLINADGRLWDDIENGSIEFIFKVIGHYRRDNAYIDWQEQAENHPNKDFRQYYQDLIDHQDHKDDENADKLRIFYDPSDSLEHLDFYDLKRSDCSKDAGASLLPDNWLEMTVSDRIELNPYGCSSPANMQNNGRCIQESSIDNHGSKSTRLTIDVEEVIAKDKTSAEYRVKLESP